MWFTEGSVGITWELDRNANSQALPEAHCIRISASEVSNLCNNTPFT